MPLLMLSKFIVPIVAKSEGKGKLPKKENNIPPRLSKEIDSNF